ncbi:glycoside hydrolase family 127 protein [Catenovulum agarivorans]|nr:beta-L-arabinofuranosidase domain-containing protein [Catenovulum agarivorans]
MVLVTFSVILTARAHAHSHISPFNQFHPIKVGDSVWTEGFWADKFHLAETAVVPSMGETLKSDISHAYADLKIAAGLIDGEHKGTAWQDGDFYKWMEANLYLYAINKDPEILTELDEIIQVIGKAQQPNGYLSSFIQNKGKAPWTRRNDHELYNSGHLISAGVLHKRITGKSNFYNIAVKNADYLYKTFMPTPKKLARFGFNPSHIMALVELYRQSKQQKYLELAIHFVELRAPEKKDWFGDYDPTVLHIHQGDMVQERTPLREEHDAVGHAVLGMYLWAGAADIYAETGDKSLIEALTRIWDSANNRKMFVHGGIGQIDKGAAENFDFIHEGFIYDYMMPNARGYAETCANIANALFNYKLMSILGDSKFIDNAELVLYNSMLSAVSLDGTKFFYTNPLRKVNGVLDYDNLLNETPVRKRYFSSFCCPPNLAKILAYLSTWAYSLSENGVVVNLFGGNKLNTKLLDGSALKLIQSTDYPWQGDILIKVDEAKAEPFDMRIRIPSWAQQPSILVNGKPVASQVLAGQYAVLNRSWKKGDLIEISLPMQTQLIEGHPRIEEVRNHAAIKRGPIVYALESVDLPKDTDILDVYLPTNADLKVEKVTSFLGGVNTINTQVFIRTDKKQGMYRALTQPEFKSVDTRFVPYFAWANRGDEHNEMSVFLPILWQSPAAHIH